MTRREYTIDQRNFRGAPGTGDEPVEGYYRVKIVRGGPYVGARIFYGEVFADGVYATYGWVAERNGVQCNVNHIWPHCGRDPITREEYDQLITAMKEPGALDPNKPIDLNKIPPIRFDR